MKGIVNFFAGIAAVVAALVVVAVPWVAFLFVIGLSIRLVMMVAGVGK